MSILTILQQLFFDNCFKNYMKIEKLPGIFWNLYCHYWISESNEYFIMNTFCEKYLMMM